MHFSYTGRQVTALAILAGEAKHQIIPLSDQPEQDTRELASMDEN